MRIGASAPFLLFVSREYGELMPERSEYSEDSEDSEDSEVC